MFYCNIRSEFLDQCEKIFYGFGILVFMVSHNEPRSGPFYFEIV